MTKHEVSEVKDDSILKWIVCVVSGLMAVAVAVTLVVIADPGKGSEVRSERMIEGEAAVLEFIANNRRNGLAAAYRQEGTRGL